MSRGAANPFPPALRIGVLLFVLVWGYPVLNELGVVDAVLGWETGQSDEVAELNEACSGGNAWSCNELGTAIRDSWGRQRHGSLARSEELFSKACSQGLEDGCLNMAELILAYPSSREKDLFRALQILENACERDMAVACGRMGNLLIDGIPNPPPPTLPLPADPDRARAALEKACQAEVSDSCLVLGRLLAEGGNPAGAEELFAQACDRDLGEACAELALQVREREGTLPLEIARKACELQHPPMCSEVAAVLLKSPDPERYREGIASYLGSCEQGDMNACYHLSEQLRARPRDLGEHRAAVQARLREVCGEEFETACRQGIRVAQLRAIADGRQNSEYRLQTGLCAGGRGDPVACASLREELEWACKVGDVVSCNELAVLLIQSARGPFQGPENNPITLYDRACSGGYGRACFNLATIYEAGLYGVSQDDTKARQLFARACKRGYGIACAKAPLGTVPRRR